MTGISESFSAKHMVKTGIYERVHLRTGQDIGNRISLFSGLIPAWNAHSACRLPEIRRGSTGAGTDLKGQGNPILLRKTGRTQAEL